MTLTDPQLIARFKIHLRRVTGVSLNTQRFIDEPEYAKSMIDKAEEENDETLVTIAVQLRYGADEVAAAPVVAPQALPGARTKAGERTYLFGARGG